MRMHFIVVALAVLALCCSAALVDGRGPYAVPDLLIPCTGNTSCKVDPTIAAVAMPGSCNASASQDFAARNTLPQYTPSNPTPSRWGPWLLTYQNVSTSQIPPACNPTAWAWRRLQEAIMSTVAMGLNYCHHHAPGYVAVAPYQIWCNGTNDATCVCNKVGENRTYPWAGLDCSNYVGWIYNYAFGYYPTTGIDSQACSPTLAPGRLLSTINVSKQDQLRPGDLLYISGSSTSPSITHVIMWTGFQVDFNATATGPLANATLVANLPAIQQSGAVSCMKKRRSLGLPVYVISDSSYTGPNLRPFCGWYASSFSHARRVINPDTTQFPQTYNETVAYYNGTTLDCISKAVLRG